MNNRKWRALYLHGFASGPQSQKAGFFKQRLEAIGISVEIPDLAGGDFKSLTLSGQLEVIDSLLDKKECPALLIGSSMGGYLAALYATHHPDTVKACILLAPAFDFYRLWIARMTEEELNKWKTNGTIEVFHYGLGHNASVGYQLLTDAERYEPFPAVTQPTLIFHGTHDDVVPITNSERFAQQHKNTQLVRFPSGHELTNVLEPMWRETETFLGNRAGEDPMLDCG